MFGVDDVALLYGGAALVTALVGVKNYFDSQKAQKAGKERLDEIRKTFDAIKPPQLDATIESPVGIISQAIPPSNFDFSRLTPAQYKVVGHVNPEFAQYIGAQQPHLIKETEGSREGLNAQREALNRLRQVAAGGPNPDFERQLNESSRRAQAEAQSRNAQILQEANRRGTMNSGLAAGAQLQAGSDAMSRLANLDEVKAQQNYRAQLDAIRDMASTGKGLREQDFDMQKSNADTINRLNELTTKSRQDWEYSNAVGRERAQIANFNAQNDAEKYNAQESTRVAENQQARGDRLAETQFGQMQSERNNTNKLGFDLAHLRAGQREALNNARLGNYNAQLHGVEAQQGLNSGYDVYNRDAIAGQTALGGAVASGLGTAGAIAQNNQRETNANNRIDRLNNAEDERAVYQRTGKWPRLQRDPNYQYAGTTYGEG